MAYCSPIPKLNFFKAGKGLLERRVNIVQNHNPGMHMVGREYAHEASKECTMVILHSRVYPYAS